MKNCLICGTPSWRCKFCRECELEKHKASAVVSQNAKKLKDLLRGKRMTTKWFEKFLVYTENIRKSGKVLMKFKTADELRGIIVVNNIK